MSPESEFRLHLIYNSVNQDEQKKLSEFQRVCSILGVELITYDATMYKVPEETLLRHNDLLYRSAISYRSQLIERMLTNEQCTSFQTDWRQVYSDRTSTWWMHHKLGLPCIPSYPEVPHNESALRDVVATLGPFPIIVKVVGGSLGVGVIRVDTIEGFRSLCDFLRARNEKVLIRKYINHSYYVRAVVIGDMIVAAHKAYVMEGEFRTNAGDDSAQIREIYHASAEIHAEVVRAVACLGIEFAGVDLLFDTTGAYYIAEVNFPCNFTVTQQHTGVDIAQEMVRYLMKKSSIK